MLTRLTDDHKKFLRIETIVSTVISVVASAALAYAVYPKDGSEIALWGMGGIAFDLVPTTFMIVFMTGIALGLITRLRMARGGPAGLTLDELGTSVPIVALRRMPRALFGRSFAMAAVVAVVLLPLMIGALALLGVETMSLPVFMVFKMIYGAALSFVFTPPILLLALANPPRASA